MLKHVASFLTFCASLLALAGTAEASTDCTKFTIDGTASTPLTVVATPTAGGCTAQMSNGYPIPDPKCTPGAVNPGITQAVLQDPAFGTKCVRNDASSEEQKAETYEWYSVPHPADNSGQHQTCELDHLISLELGGADTLDNIWPQCGPDGVALNSRYFKIKDSVENFLAAQVKAGTIQLADAQQCISTDWTQYVSDAQTYKRTPAPASGSGNDKCRPWA